MNPKEIILTEEQSKVVHSWGTGISVIAGAGSGKTFTLVQKIRALLLKKKEARFVAVSFTEKSAKELKEKLTDLTLELFDEGLKNHWVTTIHGLCAHIIKDFPREAGFDGTETQLTETEAKEFWTRSVDRLWFKELPEPVSKAVDQVFLRENFKGFSFLLSRLKNLDLSEIKSTFNDPHLLVVSEFVNEHYTLLKKQSGVIDFEDLEKGAKRALLRPHVRDHYRKIFDLVLVDEFQDTNPTQSVILRSFCREDLSNCCVVGDPKQSIYRFRDADVSVFNEFCEDLPLKVILNKNYRSVPEVLHFCNEVCAPLFTSSLLEYQPLYPMRESSAGSSLIEQPIVHLRVESPDDLADFLISESSRGIDLSEYVLLLRQIKNKSDTWLSRLMEKGIPLSIESGGLLWSDPRAREILSFLRFIVFPEDEIYGVQFIRAPWVTEPRSMNKDQWLDQILRDKTRHISLWESFLNSNFPLAERLREFFEKKIHLKDIRCGEMLQLLLAMEDCSDALGVILLNLWHQCESLSERGYSKTETIEFLTLQMKEEQRAGVVAPPEQEGLLRVMTIHGSKGLEFKRVILIEFKDSPKKASSTPLLFWDRKRGAYLLDRDEEGEKDKKNPNVIAWSEWEKNQELSESKRLFYVALTRAKNQLILVCEPPSEKAPPKKEIDPHYRDYWRKWIEPFLPEPLLLDQKNLKGEFCGSELKAKERQSLCLEKMVKKRPRHSVSELLKLSLCERQYRWSILCEEQDLAILQKKEKTSMDKEQPVEEELFFEKTVENLNTNESSSHHSVSQNNEDSLKLNAKTVGTEVHLALEFLEEERIDALKDQAGSQFPFHALKQFIEKDRVFRSTPFLDVIHEFSFEVPILLKTLDQTPFTEVLVGSVDRIEKDFQNNKIRVIDYKVLRKNSSDSHLIDRYGFQLKCYAWAVSQMTNTPIENMEAELLVFYGTAKSSQRRSVRIPLGTTEEMQSYMEKILLKASQLIANFNKVEELERPFSEHATPGHYCVRCPHLRICDSASLE